MVTRNATSMGIFILHKGYILHFIPVNYCVSMALTLRRTFNPQRKHLTPSVTLDLTAKTMRISLLEYDTGNVTFTDVSELLAILANGDSTFLQTVRKSVPAHKASHPITLIIISYLLTHSEVTNLGILAGTLFDML